MANYNALLTPGANPGGAMIQGAQAAQQQALNAQRMNMLNQQEQRDQQAFAQNSLTQRRAQAQQDETRQHQIEIAAASAMAYSPQPKIDAERFYPEYVAQLKQSGQWDTITDDQVRQQALQELRYSQAQAGVVTEKPADPVTLSTENVGGFNVLRDNTGKVISSQVPDRPQTPAREPPESFSPFTQADGSVVLVGNRGSIKKDTGLTAPAKGDSSGKTELPIGALRLVDDAKQAISSSTQSLGLVDRAIRTLDSGKVNLGILSNAVARGKNAAGMSSDSSRAYADIKQTLEKLRNNYLLLAKGVQTEGDATRAWNSEIGESVQNDNELARQQLGKARQMITDMVSMQNDRIDTVYSNYGSARLTAPVGAPPASNGGWTVRKK